MRNLADDTMAVVLAGGKGTRLGPLTRHVCKPAMPFGAVYRNIDFSLSNCWNSDIRRIGIATQYKAESLLYHLEEVWSGAVTRPEDYLRAWPAEDRAPSDGYKGTADAVFRNLDRIARPESRLVLILAGDHVYQMDYRPMLEYHRRRQADVTVGCVTVEAEEASQLGILSVGRRGRVEGFVEKPESADELPGGDRILASMGIYVFGTRFLADVLRQDALTIQSSHDFGKDILPRLLPSARVFAYPFMERGSDRRGYWRDVGTPAAYWRAHMELLDVSPGLRLDDDYWPVHLEKAAPQLTAYRTPSSRYEEIGSSLVADGAEIHGSVHHSVLFAGTKVSRGAFVERSIVLPGAIVGRNCRVSGAIVDSGCRIPDGTRIGTAHGSRDSDWWKEPAVVTADDFSHERSYSYA